MELSNGRSHRCGSSGSSLAPCSQRNPETIPQKPGPCHGMEQGSNEDGFGCEGRGRKLNSRLKGPEDGLKHLFGGIRPVWMRMREGLQPAVERQKHEKGVSQRIQHKSSMARRRRPWNS